MGRLVNWLRGTVTAEAEGPYPERMLNILAAAGVGFWKSERLTAERIRFCLLKRDWSRAQTLSSQARCSLYRCGAEGAAEELLRRRHRWGLIAGFMLTALLLTAANQFVLVIEVEGNQQVTSQQILSQLKEAGFGIGSWGPGIDVREISNAVLRRDKSLAFLTIDRRGILARVVVREREPVPELRDETSITEITAARDGVIAKVEEVSGRPLVEQGSAVRQGEVLISSLLTYEPEDGTAPYALRQVRAEGRVWAYTRRVVRGAAPLETLLWRGEPEKGSQFSAKFWMGTRIFFGNSSHQPGQCAKITLEYPVFLGKLPAELFSLQRRREWSAQEQCGQLSPEGVQTYLTRHLMERLRQSVESGEILQTEVKTVQQQGVLFVTVTADCLEQIGVPVVLEP